MKQILGNAGSTGRYWQKNDVLLYNMYNRVVVVPGVFYLQHAVQIDLQQYSRALLMATRVV